MYFNSTILWLHDLINGFATPRFFSCAKWENNEYCSNESVKLKFF